MALIFRQNWMIAALNQAKYFRILYLHYLVIYNKIMPLMQVVPAFDNTIWNN